MKYIMSFFCVVFFCAQASEVNIIMRVVEKNETCFSPRQQEIIKHRSMCVQEYAAKKEIDESKLLCPANIAQDEKAILALIKTLSNELGLSNMDVAEKMLPVSAHRIALQNQLLNSYNDQEKGLSLAQEAFKKGADLDFTFSNNSTDHKDRLTPLLWLCRKPIYSYAEPLSEKQKWIMKFAQWLIDNGADINATTDFGLNTLGVSINYNNQPLALLLVALNKISIDQRDRQGATGLHYAATQATMFSDGPQNLRKFFFKFAYDMIGELIKRKANRFISRKITRGIATEETETPLQFVAVYCGTQYSDDQKNIFDMLEKGCLSSTS